jgi:outer membrane protein OmpA-like peptidoglycan-associated protein
MFLTPSNAFCEVPRDLVESLSKNGLALIIGVSSYRGGWDRLPQVMREVDTLANGLAPHFAHVFTLKDPTIAELRSTMRDFLLGRGNVTDERIFIFYAGHGFTDLNQNADRSTGYITGTDTPVYNPDAPQVDQAIAFEEIDAWNRQTRARHVLMVFDSCFAGSLFLTRAALQTHTYDFGRLRKLNDEPSRYYITSGDETNEVPADSPMADLILRGLNGEADLDQSGYVTEEDLAVFIKRNIARYSQRPLNPLSGSIGDVRLSQGKFIFLTGLTQQVVRPQVPGPESDQVAPHPSRVYMVFFDWDRADLSERAREIIHDAAGSFARIDARSIIVNGYTDATHTPEYAMELSKREALSVAAELIRDGVPKEAIQIRAYGQAKLLVPTAEGVREPQNRRAEIIIQG